MTSVRCQDNALHLGVAQTIKDNDRSGAFGGNDRSFYCSFVYVQDWDAATACEFLAKVIQ